MNIQKLMRQAQQMQAKMQAELAEVEIEASAGGGMVTVTMNGHKQLLAVALEPEVVDPEERDMLQDLIVAAINEASRQVDEAIQARVGSMAGGLGLPGLG